MTPFFTIKQCNFAILWDKNEAYNWFRVQTVSGQLITRHRSDRPRIIRHAWVNSKVGYLPSDKESQCINWKEELTHMATDIRWSARKKLRKTFCRLKRLPRSRRRWKWGDPESCRSEAECTAEGKRTLMKSRKKVLISKDNNLDCFQDSELSF